MANDVPREVLPIPDRPYVGPTMYDARDPGARYQPIEPLRPPEGAPNVLLVLLDDAGFGSNSAFGGPCRTPTFERLAAGGLRYTRFHTTAICSSTRLALLTGRNHHSVGMGTVSDMATAAPGYTSRRPNTAATIAEVLRLNGYSTAQFGKCHEVPTWEWSPMGPFDRWPTGNGFEYFYGFIGGESSQFYPSLVEGTNPVAPDRGPEEGYHLTEDIATKARRWLSQQRGLVPDKPFFLYFAPGATHAPIHVPEGWRDRYRGAFDKGWDVVREETFARQKRLGIVPPDCALTPRPEGIPAWRDVPDEMKPVLARQMELYAAFLEHTDQCVGQVIDAIEALGALDDTLIYVITGDNGASGEGTLNGTWNESLTMTGMVDIETPEFLRARLESFGTPRSYPQYSLGWAHAMDTPYQWTKRVASHWGGTRNGLIVHWPRVLEARGELRHQFHHVIDVAPTFLEVAGLPHPLIVHGVDQQPIEGVSMAYSFNDAGAPERHETQYFEILGNRGIYHRGWTAVTAHNPPVAGRPQRALEDDVWELYDTNADWTQAHDLAGREPGKLRDLQRLFLIEAAKHNVLPLDDRAADRANPDVAGRPVLARGRRQRLYRGIGRLNAFTVISIKNKSHRVTAEVVVPAGGGEGVIVAQGGLPGGWSIYAKGGRPKYCYNFYGVDLFYVEGTEPLPEGTHLVRMDFDYDGGGPAKGGTVRLLIDDRPVGEGRVGRTGAGDEQVGVRGGRPPVCDPSPRPITTRSGPSSYRTLCPKRSATRTIRSRRPLRPRRTRAELLSSVPAGGTAGRPRGAGDRRGDIMTTRADGGAARMPALFLGHGNPLNALERNAYTEAWARLAATLPRPHAILAISAHWYVAGSRVTAEERPRTIHDFGGFPRALYEVQYPAPGSTALAARVRDLLAPAPVAPDRGWGLDHGTWSLLVHLFPDATVPVVQLGLDETLTARQHYALARRLRPLRAEGVLLLGSGNVVHNLHAYSWGRHPVDPYDWAVRFEGRVRESIRGGQHEAVVAYEGLGADAALAVPTPEHYLPLLYVLAQAEPDEAVTFPVEGFDGGSVSMLGVRIG